MWYWQVQADEIQQLRQQVDNLQAGRGTENAQDYKKEQLRQQADGLHTPRATDEGQLWQKEAEVAALKQLEYALELSRAGSALPVVSQDCLQLWPLYTPVHSHHVDGFQII